MHTTLSRQLTSLVVIPLLHLQMHGAGSTEVRYAAAWLQHTCTCCLHTHRDAATPLPALKFLLRSHTTYTRHSNKCRLQAVISGCCARHDTHEPAAGRSRREAAACGAQRRLQDSDRSIASARSCCLCTIRVLKGCASRKMPHHRALRLSVSCSLSLHSEHPRSLNIAEPRAVRHRHGGSGSAGSSASGES